MAYISKEKVSEIRTELKQRFPDCKFSVRKTPQSIAVVIRLLKSKIEVRTPPEFDKGVLEFHSKSIKRCNGLNYYGKQLFTEVVEIANKGNRDNSDPMIDYFDVGWYIDLSVGDWGRPYEVEEEGGYDVVFHNDDNSMSKGWSSKASICFNYIEMFNGTDESYFADFKGGTVQVQHNESGTVLFEQEII